MLKSMTGYGSKLHEEGNLRVSVEVRTLNSKNLDPVIRVPKKYNEKEQEIRKMLSEVLERGKITISMDVKHVGVLEPSVSFNKELAKSYYAEIMSLANVLDADKEDILKTVLQLPNVMESVEEKNIPEEEWKIVKGVVQEVLEACNSFRKAEGQQLQIKLESYVNKIGAIMEEIKKRDPERLKHVKEKLQKAVDDKLLKADVDQNRFEQELIYYIEKLDIEEEKTRLASHIQFFQEVIDTENKGVGKKLGFISQEMGREINTMGSKANDAEIQRLVVGMKDELEKIKEQTLNIL